MLLLIPVLLGAVGGTSVGVLIPLRLASGVVKNCSDRSSPEAWLVAMSRSSLVVLGRLCLSLWTSNSQVVPDRKSLMTSVSATSGSSLHCLEKR
jgi:hypothetical protein